MPKKTVTLPIPNLSNLSKLSGKNYAPVLVVLLIIASFLLGILFTKVQYLENGQGTVNTAGTVANDTTAQVPTGPVDVKEGHLPVLGQEDAKVTIIEFSDFQCPFCEQLWKETLPQIKKEYVETGKVKFAYRHYPLDFHANAEKAAEASECANEQGKFWEMHDKLFENQAKWESQGAADALTTFASLADEVGISGANLKSCVESGKFEKTVKDDLAEGTTVGVQGTPATYINGLLVSGAQPYSAFKTIIDQELAK
ncbi:MAG: DsbA family protein [Candidatus Levybacteria bacterium]|nr:DsbA family protein [Candidatus Levybacteria bacterium]